MENQFNLTDIEDIRIIVKAKGKHWGMVPKENMRETAHSYRLAAFVGCLEAHDIVDTPLEEIKQKIK